MSGKAHVGIERMDAIRSRVDLLATNIGRGMDNLALQVRQRNNIVVDDAERANARGRQIHQRRRTEPARTDHEDRCLFEGRLPGTADVPQHDMSGVAFKFARAQHDGIPPSAPVPT